MNDMKPPPVPGQGSNNTALKIVLVVLFFVIVPCGVLGYFAMQLGKSALTAMSDTFMPVASCAMNFEFSRDAALDYAKDHKGILPSAAHWADEIEPYYRKLAAKNMSKSAEVLGTKFEFKAFPKEGVWTCDNGPKQAKTGIAMNVQLAGKKLSEITDPKGTILFFETTEPKRNDAQEFVAKSKSSAPKVFGSESRDWITVPIVGESNFELNSKKGARVRFDAGNETKDPAAKSGE